MSTALEKFKEDLDGLLEKALLLELSILKDASNISDEQFDELIDQKKKVNFHKEYETWYTEALEVVRQLIPNRLGDFIKCYKDEKRKEISNSNYTISDYLSGIKITQGVNVIAEPSAAISKFKKQHNILRSAKKKFSSSLLDIKHLLQADLFDSELDQAEELQKKGFLRASGVISAVVLEKHLRQVLDSHNVKYRKKKPTINDLNDYLKENSIIDLPDWRFIQHLADIRNKCAHSKDREPTKSEVDDLIKGVKKISKTIY